MNTYEILIYGMTDDSEMNHIQDVLAQRGIFDAGDSEVGAYLMNDKPRSVFVDPSEVAEAVKIINAVGYATDEDESDDEE